MIRRESSKSSSVFRFARRFPWPRTISTKKQSGTKRFRHWFQFRLRLALVAITLVGLALGYRQARIRYYQDQRKLADSLVEKRIRVDFAMAEPKWLTYLCGGDCFEITRIQCNHPGTEIDFSILKEFPYLYRLKLRGNSVTDDMLDPIANCRNLRRLYIEQSKITDVGFRKLANLSDLSYLGLSYTPLTDESLSIISRFNELENLVLPSGVTDERLGELNRLEKLTKLDVRSAKITAAGLAKIDRIKDIDVDWLTTVLKRSDTKDIIKLPWIKWLDWQNGMHEDLFQLPDIERFKVTGQRISRSSLSQLPNLSKLRRLGFFSCILEPTGMRHLAELENLEWLEFRNCKNIHGWSKHVRQLENLTELRCWNLRGVQIRELEDLAVLPNLTSLQINIGEEDFYHAMAIVSKFPQLEVLGMNLVANQFQGPALGIPIPGSGLQHLHGCRTLQVLTVEDRLGFRAQSELSEYYEARKFLFSARPDLYIEDFAGSIGTKPKWFDAWRTSELFSGDSR